MKTKLKLINRAALRVLLTTFTTFYVAQLATAFAQGTAFTYQGRLNSGGTPANGNYDLVFALYNDPLIGSQIGTAITNSAMPVTNGLFTATVDFGGAPWTGQLLYLQILVRTNGNGALALLNPRQQVTPAPYSILAANAGSAGSVAAANISGTILNASLPANPTFSGTVTASGGLSGNGANVTNVNAATLNGLSATNLWQSGGNNVANGQFLGSTNNQAMEVRVGNQRALMITTNPADSANIIGGSPANFIDSGVKGAVIAGGGTTNILTYLGSSSSNHISADFSTIGGGSGNWIQTGADHSVIGNGMNNVVAANTYESVIAGGVGNTVSGQFLVIGGGTQNTNTGYAATLGGGYGNFASSYYGTVGGGVNNSATASYATIGGGQGNQAGFYATVPGGLFNIAGGQLSFAAGFKAQALNQGAFVWADSQNAPFASTANNQFNVRAGGGVLFVTSGAGMTIDGQSVLTTGSGISIQQNANGAPDVIEGSPGNFVPTGTMGATIGGGGASYYYGDTFLTNSVTADFGTVGGGGANTASGYAATVAGGQVNIASGSYATVAGGAQNTASASYATVGGGNDNIAGITGATVPGGEFNLAAGQNSFAAGQQAQALNQGAFVWADSQGVPFGSTSTNQFLIRAQGGVGINTNNPGATLDVNGSFRVNNGTVFNRIQAGQAIMPGSSLVATNFTVTFPQAFTSTPKVIASLSGDPSFPSATDTFAMSIRAITTTTGFTVNVVRVDTATGWSQQLRINWQAWQ
jgi:hypothetical protein